MGQRAMIKDLFTKKRRPRESGERGGHESHVKRPHRKEKSVLDKEDGRWCGRCPAGPDSRMLGS